MNLKIFPLCQSHNFVDYLERSQPIVSPGFDISDYQFLADLQERLTVQDTIAAPNIPPAPAALWPQGHSAPAFTWCALTEPVGQVPAIFSDDPLASAHPLHETIQRTYLEKLTEILSKRVLDEQLRSRFLQRITEEIGNLRYQPDEDLEDLEAKLRSLQETISEELRGLKVIIEQQDLLLPAKEAEIENLKQVLGVKIKELQKKVFESLTNRHSGNGNKTTSEHISTPSPGPNGYEHVIEQSENIEPPLNGEASEIEHLRAEIQDMEHRQKLAAIEIENLRAELEKKELLLSEKEEQIKSLQEKELLLPATMSDIENVKQMEALLAAKEAEIQNLKQMEALLTTKNQEIEKLKQTSAAKIRELQDLALDNLAKSQAAHSKRKSSSNFLNYIGKKT